MSDNTLPTDVPRKLVIGWFSFTCCEGCTILLSELLNDHLLEWKKVVEFRHLKTLKTKNELRDLDVAFVEGAISSETQAEELRKIRENSKYLVGIGACACTGKPSASRNEFDDEKLNYKILWYFNQFNYSEKVKKLDEIVKVDDQVPGCPMNADLFLKAVEKYLKQFNII
ncbi:MAG: hypothetical protein ACOX6V_01855 [Patescibacteria group bacterium]|jgi:sulfhydrogenase subunit delta